MRIRAQPYYSPNSDWKKRTAIFLACLAANCSFAGDQLLFDFTGKFDPAKVQTTDAVVSFARSATSSLLRVQTGHQQPWPGITLPCPDGSWDLSPFAELTV